MVKSARDSRGRVGGRERERGRKGGRKGGREQRWSRGMLEGACEKK